MRTKVVVVSSRSKYQRFTPSGENRMKHTAPLFSYQLRFLMIAVLMCVLGTVSVTAGPQSAITGTLTIVGKVLVDGNPVATGDVINSGSTPTTAKGSIAV